MVRFDQTNDHAYYPIPGAADSLRFHLVVALIMFGENRRCQIRRHGQIKRYKAVVVALTLCVYPSDV
jgi:hypothetical protein